MAPKKKGNKKANDDWDEGLGEVADPIAAATAAAKADEDDDAQDGEVDRDNNAGSGGLLAALKKNRGKKAKKGKVIQDIEYEPEATPAVDGANGTATEEVDLAAKAPVEASMDDEDLFAAPTKKGKGAKANGKTAVKEDRPTPTPTPPPAAEKPDADEDEEVDGEDEDDDTGRVKTKKEKEKEKREREKQRKKEQASLSLLSCIKRT